MTKSDANTRTEYDTIGYEKYSHFTVSKKNVFIAPKTENSLCAAALIKTKVPSFNKRRKRT